LRQAQNALFGQQKLPLGHVKTCEPFGQVKAWAGVGARIAAVPATAAKTIIRTANFLRIKFSPR
jgi:hypothetical protein